MWTIRDMRMCDNWLWSGPNFMVVVMRSLCWRLVTFVFVAAIGVGFVSRSDAYVLPAKQVLSFMVARLGAIPGLKVSQSSVLAGVDSDAKPSDETLYFSYPDHFRAEVKANGVQEIRVISSDGAIVISDGKIAAETMSRLDHFVDLLMCKNVECLVSRLVKLNIDPRIVSLGKFKDRIGYIVGANYPDETVSQAWIEKDSFLPMRLLLVERDGVGGRSVTDIVYGDYRAVIKDKDGSYPGQIACYDNGRLVKTQIVSTFEVAPRTPDRFFDLSHLRRVYKPVESTSSGLLPGQIEMEKAKKNRP